MKTPKMCGNTLNTEIKNEVNDAVSKKPNSFSAANLSCRGYYHLHCRGAQEREREREGESKWLALQIYQ